MAPCFFVYTAKRMIPEGIKKSKAHDNMAITLAKTVRKNAV